MTTADTLVTDEQFLVAYHLPLAEILRWAQMEYLTKPGDLDRQRAEHQRHTERLVMMIRLGTKLRVDQCQHLLHRAAEARLSDLLDNTRRVREGSYENLLAKHDGHGSASYPSRVRDLTWDRAPA